jgi:WD40 repeat protein
VRQVHWEKEELGENLNFYSISSDGNVFNWSMSKNELKMEPVIQLKFIPLAKNDSEEMAITGLASGCCFDFNRKHDHLFLVGTEEGNIYKCSKSYSGQYLQTYSGHHMAVYAVQWNSFDDDIFISCSADWTVKVSLQDLDFVLFDCSCAYLQLYFVLAMGPYNRLSSLITGSWQRSGRRDLVSLLVHNFLGSDE